VSLTKNLLWYRDVEEGYEPEWLIKGIWEKNSLNMLIGSPKAHKSALRRFLVSCVLSNTDPWNEFPVETVPKRILQFIGEDRPGAERAMFDNLAKSLGIDDFEDKLAFVQGHQFKIDNLTNFNQLKKMVADEGFELVIFDSLRSFHNKNENDSEEIAQVFNPLTELKHLTTVVCIHHTPKPVTSPGFGGARRTIGEEARGSGAIAGYADTVTRLIRVGKGNRHKLGFETKELWEPDEIHVMLDSEHWNWRLYSGQLTPELVILAVKEEQGVAKTKLIRKLGHRHEDCKDVIEGLLKEKKLKNRQEGRYLRIYTSDYNFP